MCKMFHVEHLCTYLFHVEHVRFAAGQLILGACAIPECV
jgi:hypothetical protein